MALDYYSSTLYQKKYAALGIDKNRKSGENTGRPKSRRDIEEEDASVDDSNNEGAEHDMEEMNVTNKEYV